MDESKAIAVATTEVMAPTFGVTKQFLEVHSVALEAGVPKVEAVTIDEKEHQAIVYFAVVGEKFHLAVSVSTAEAPFEVKWAWVEDCHRITFHATSENLSVQQLSELTSLKPTHIQNKGDARGKRKWPYHAIEFEPNPEPGPFEVKLEKLLTFLEQDPAGVHTLVDKADGYIRVISVFHNGNTMLGGLHLDKASVRRMAGLNLSIDIDLYAEGNFFKN